MSNNTSHFSNDDYQVTMVQEPGCAVQCTIVVSPKAAQASHRKAIKAINKEVSLPGFRKGKAPEETILKHYPSHVEKEWKDLLLQGAFNHAMELTNIYPFQKESVKKANISKHSLEEGATVEVSFESMPVIPTVDLAEISIPNVDAEPVTDKRVNQILEDIRYRFADWEKVEGRPVEKGDFVDVDIENLDNPGEFLCQDTRLEVNDGKVGNWLLNLLVGMNVGDSKEATSENEESFDVETFKPTLCKVTVKEINKSILPEINDALAEKAGLASADELIDRIKKDLATMHKNEANQKKRHLIERAILDKYPFEVPQSLVNGRAQQMMDDHKAGLEKRGEKEIEKELKEAEEHIFRTVKDRYRWYFITQKTAQDQGIRVDQNEVLGEMLRRKYMNPDNDMDFNPDSMKELFAYLSSALLSDKVCDFFIEKSSKSS